METININVAGDTFLGRRIEPIALNNPESLFDKKIVQLFSKADFNILNLESPLTDKLNNDKILKTGPNLKADPGTINAILPLNIHLVTLANNHIYDFGSKGLTDTLNLCKSKNIDTVGAGNNLEDASRIFIKSIKGLKLGILNFAENEWCNANNERGGANPMDVVGISRSIKKAKEETDIIILILHGGHEQSYYPSPRMVDQYRFYAEQGASIIIGHHSHCISGHELYKGVPIYYGLGNFLFDSELAMEGWHEGLILNIQITPEKLINCKLYPTFQDKVQLNVKLLEGESKTQLEEKIEKINLCLKNSKILYEKFEKLSLLRESEILSTFSTSHIIDNKLFRKVLNKLKLEKYFLRKSQIKTILNLVRCEAHHDISKKVLLDYLNKNKNK